MTCIGDCVRVVSLVRGLVQGKGLPAGGDINVDGDVNNPATWSVGQFATWASAGPLRDIADLLKKHRFAGDILLLLSIDAAQFLLELNHLQVAAFEDEITSLRERCICGLCCSFIHRLLLNVFVFSIQLRQEDVIKVA